MELGKSLHFICHGAKCEFRTLGINDVTEAYVEGLRQQKKYLENNPCDTNKNIQQEYIKRIIDSENDTICGLFVDSVLIGTAGIQNIFCKGECITTFGIFIFSQNFRGKGYGKTLVWASAFLVNACNGVTRFGAGMEKQNMPSLKCFLSSGFKKVFEDDKLIKVELNYKHLKVTEFISHIEVTRNK